MDGKLDRFGRQSGMECGKCVSSLERCGVVQVGADRWSMSSG